ncbi:MAG: TlpA disulfide reductase family protein [Bacteroidota bacterium]|nr:TlpA disulfide reductase family protein [Bacteroidota bacterium]MDP4254402.1 TlpA disulfide reductase family protein [Bacteroidota bacterium]MDP4256941.1 TlpA disulfide reductase family protein [Bacteroidota bacterium]
MIRLTFITALLTFGLTPVTRARVKVAPHYAALANGYWSAAVQRPDGHGIAFTFEVKDSAGRQILYIRNAGEHLLVDDIEVNGDSVLIRLPFFESQFRAVLIREGMLRGTWYKRLTDHYQLMPFTATYGGSRFPSDKTPIADISGRWAAWFGDSSRERPELLVGEFRQQGKHLTGTFLEQTGDYRFLEGVVDGDSMRLSCFDGSHAYLFTAHIDNDGRISGGQYYAGPTYHQPWMAVRDANAKLPDEFTLTKWKKDRSHIQFSFRDLDGKTVSFSDPRFHDKIVLIQLMGSWCPNCMDETRFLSKFYDEYHDKGLEIVALAYERSTDFARSRVSVRSFRQRFDVKYPMLITGVSVSDSLRAEKTLPQLDAIVGFPTTIFVNRHGDIEKIHTGFNGPGTGEHYEEQKKEFYKTVDAMLAE